MKNNMAEEKYDFMSFEIGFSDMTLLEANGEYTEVKRLMDAPQKFLGKMYVEPPNKNWVLKSTITLQHALGFSGMICDFYYDGQIIVTAYSPSVKDVHSPDLRCLTFWAQQNGWKVPEPKPMLVDDWKEFWKRQWETYIINSPYLEKKYGERRAIIFGDDSKEEDDDNDAFREKIEKL